ncbi:hypothetical protein P4268_28695 [Bacillus thuringiensis]|nr:hypothetical protein [Bacillus thuringiensis]
MAEMEIHKEKIEAAAGAKEFFKVLFQNNGETKSISVRYFTCNSISSRKYFSIVKSREVYEVID